VRIQEQCGSDLDDLLGDGPEEHQHDVKNVENLHNAHVCGESFSSQSEVVVLVCDGFEVEEVKFRFFC
jgi:hypothetical protein